MVTKIYQFHNAPPILPILQKDRTTVELTRWRHRNANNEVCPTQSFVANSVPVSSCMSVVFNLGIARPVGLVYLFSRVANPVGVVYLFFQHHGAEPQRRGAPEARGPMRLHRLHWLKAGPERAQILWNWKITVGLPSFIVCLPIITWTAIVRQTFLANMLAGLLGMQSPALEPSQHSSMPGGQSCYRCYGQLSSSCVPNKIAMPSEFVMWPFWPIVFG